MGMILGSGGSNGRRGRRSLNAEINITPFVDVMLVLLIIFMITATALIRGEEVNLPKTKSGAMSVQTGDPLSITVKRNGDLSIQNTEIELKDLASQLAAVLGEGYDEQIYIRGDANVPYGRVMEVTAEIRSVGYTRVAFVTEQPG